MGLLDNLANAMLSRVGSEQGKVAQIAIDLLNQHGGLAGILDQFNANGMAEQVRSWVGSDSNLPITAEQVTDVLGGNVMAEIAAKFSISQGVLGNTIAEHLPSIIDKMTPDGIMPTGSSNALSALLGMLK